MKVIDKTPKIKKTPVHYVNNKQFLESLIEHGKNVRRAKRLKEPAPPVPEYVGECFLKIANKLSTRPNFMNYPFREDMIGDGILNCLNYVDNFNPKKSKNPFAYFTQIMWFAFVRRIQGEKKALVLKYKAIQNSPFFQDLCQQKGDDSAYDNTYVQFVKKNMGEMIADFENKKKEKKVQGRKKGNLEKFLE